MCLSSDNVNFRTAQRQRLIEVFDYLEQDFTTNMSADSLSRSGISEFAIFQDTQSAVRIQ